jgi:hypothetical protein
MGVMNCEQLRMEVRIVHVDHFTETFETSLSGIILKSEPTENSSLMRYPLISLSCIWCTEILSCRSHKEVEKLVLLFVVKFLHVVVTLKC